MKQPKPILNLNTSANTLHAPLLPHIAEHSSLRGQTEPTPGSEQVREEMHTQMITPGIEAAD